MLEITHLTKIYKPKKGVPVTALDDISLKLPDKGMVFILGKSGSGKSTLLNVLGGLDSFTSGEFIIKGEAARGFKQMHYDSYRNTYIGFIFQEYNILKDFSVGGNIALALELQGKPSSDEEINRILEEVDLEGYGDRKPNELSGGQLQRVAIARALVKNPDIIMADEPTGALDSKTGEAIFETLKKLSSDKLVLIVSHDRDFSERYADRIIELADGKIISDVTLKKEDINREKQEEVKANVNYLDNVVNINDGFALSDEEFLKIKEYIKNYHGPVDLNLNVKSKINNKNYVFVPTDEEDIQMDNSGFKLIKSKLSLKNSFKIGASGLKYKKVKLVFTILLSFIAFTFFGLADTIACYDLEKTTINSIIDSDIDYAAFVKSVRHDIDDNNYYYSAENFSQEEIDKLNEDTGLNLKGVYYNDKFQSLGFNSFYNLIDGDDDNDYYSYFTTQFYGSIEFSQSDLEKYGYKLIEGSTLPDGSKDELLLTKYEAQSFIGNKLVTYDDNGENKASIEIKDEKDLINKTLYLGRKNYKITGIIDTNMNIDRFKILNDGPQANLDLNFYALFLELNSLKENSMHSLLFVGPGFNERTKLSEINTLANIYNGFVYLMPTSITDLNDYHYQYYMSLFTCLELINNNDDYYIIPINEGNITKLEQNQVIISDYAMYSMLANEIDYSSELAATSVAEYNKVYNIKGTEYKIFDCLVKLSDDSLGSFIASINPVNCNYASVRYALEAINEDYDYWYNKTNEAGKLNPEFEIYSMVSYIIELGEITNTNSMTGTEIGRQIRELNASIVLDFYKKYAATDIRLTYTTYNYSDNTETSKEYNLKVVGLAYMNSYYNNSYMVLNDSIWNEYFDYNPYEVFKMAIGELDAKREIVNKLVKITLSEENNVNYKLSNNVVDEVFGFQEIFDILGQVFFYVGLVFAIFASLLLSNFIATSISYKKEEIGILRAIGSRSNDVFRIFFSEAFIIAMINFALSTLSTFIISLIINNAMRSETSLQVTIVSFGIRQIGLLLVLCIVIAFIASFLPVNKNAKKKPIDAIRNR
ncbi:MAG: ATP-binding cassette domain-containing protein [Bacilli bacterium]|nr:ATP-binding cassette domain-containing protein [Bacilli bacterium]